MYHRSKLLILVALAPALGIAQLVESVGGLVSGPDNDGRVNGLVTFHDLGLATGS